MRRAGPLKMDPWDNQLVCCPDDMLFAKHGAASQSLLIFLNPSSTIRARSGKCLSTTNTGGNKQAGASYRSYSHGNLTLGEAGNLVEFFKVTLWVRNGDFTV